jgi:hypothetical protein
MAACMWAILASSLSVTGKIEQYGAYAGFAAVLGLAVLSLLYFAQAREVKRLREWAGRAPERASELQGRVQADAARRVAPQPQQRPAPPGQAAAAAAGLRPAAATPAGQAQGVPGAAPAGAAAGAVTAAGAGAAAATPGAPGAPAAPGGQPTVLQPVANGAPAGAVQQPKPGQPLRVPGAATPPPSRPGGGGGTPSPPPEKRGRSLFAILGAAAAIIVVGLVLVFVAFGVGGDAGSGSKAANTIGTPGKSATKSPSGTAKPGKGSTTASGAPAPGSYSVSVLNGTAVPNLARGVATRLQNAKFKIDNVTNAADQSRSATLVEFAPGHQAEANSVAKAIDVGKDAIQLVDPGSRAIAGEQSAVVVIVGADQNQTPQSP